jgi:hypothetical protein
MMWPLLVVQVLQLDTTRRGSKAGNLFICEALEIVTAEYLGEGSGCRTVSAPAFLHGDCCMRALL